HRAARVAPLILADPHGKAVTRAGERRTELIKSRFDHWPEQLSGPEDRAPPPPNQRPPDGETGKFP
ncbi:MAG: hypothetical protein M3548_04460, partial [Actinomycetota bacterium]|nr:hypothetical protein [Actinomycetota bacterium]